MNIDLALFLFSYFLFAPLGVALAFLYFARGALVKTTSWNSVSPFNLYFFRPFSIIFIALISSCLTFSFEVKRCPISLFNIVSIFNVVRPQIDSAAKCRTDDFLFWSLHMTFLWQIVTPLVIAAIIFLFRKKPDGWKAWYLSITGFYMAASICVMMIFLMPPIVTYDNLGIYK